MAKWLDIGLPTEIANSECKIIEINNVPIAIFNLNGMFYAIEDNCPHQHLPLADGLVEGENITCPYHGAQFCIKTGQVLSPPACENLHTYPTRVMDGKIQIEI